jgi:hypothetical protein
MCEENALVLCCFTPAALRVVADRGMISAHPDVSVYEPWQKAILAWNGREEVMRLVMISPEDIIGI